MYNHAPAGYICPFCLVTQGIENEHVYTRQADIIFRDDFVTAFISSHHWPNNHGHAVVIPNQHYESLYDLPDDLGARIFALSRRIALAMKSTYGCDGISTRQHNEPAGNQDVWHYHLHVFPRYTGDNLYLSQPHKAITPAEERQQFAERLRRAMQ